MERRGSITLFCPGTDWPVDLVKRNAEIVALVKARKMRRREIAARYRLSVSSISMIATQHGVHVRAIDPKRVRAASDLIERGMPLAHVAETVGFNIQTLRRILEDEGLYVRSLPTPLWTEAEVRVLRRDYGKPGLSVSSIAAKLGRTCKSVSSRAALLGLSWPLEFRASSNVGRTPKLSDQQQAEALKRLAVGESCRAIARTFGVHPATISRLAR